MGMFTCLRCLRRCESHDGDSVVDPTNNGEMIHESCLTDEELYAIENEEFWENIKSKGAKNEIHN